jgi:DNA-binding response OmpR family regulator
MNQSLLIVEDDEPTAKFLADNLSADGFGVAVATGAGEGIRQLEVRHPALVLLDLSLDDGNGLQLLDRVRAADGMASRIDPDLPVIVISGRGSDSDRIRSFARGADDHVVKPLSYSELLGRIRAVLRRAEGRPQRGVVRVAGLTLDPVTRAVALDGKPVHLSVKEFSLLQRLADEPERVYSKNELLRDVWGYLSMGTKRRKSPRAWSCQHDATRLHLLPTGAQGFVQARC